MAAGAGRWRKLLKYGSLAGVGLAGAGSFLYLSVLVNHDKRKEQQRSLLANKGFNKRPSEPLPSRREQLQSLGKVTPCPGQSPLIVSPLQPPRSLMFSLLAAEPLELAVRWMPPVVA